METLGFNSPSHNPENELPQWQQKIADAENNDNNQAIGPRLSAFSPSFISHIYLSNCNGYFSRKKDHPDSVSFYHEFENLRI